MAGVKLVISLIFCASVAKADVSGGMLYPRDSESREIKLLDGLWHFRADTSPTRNAGFDKKWYSMSLSKTGPVIDMPVPSSYNDVTQDKSLRDFVGWVWYDREFFVSSNWAKDKRVVLRFDSAHYYSVVWVNGKEVMEHNGGHLPFEADISSLLNFDSSNWVTAAVNNTLTPTTLPPGTIRYESDTSRYPPGYFVQNLQMDHFDYAGIHGHVRIYTTPKTYIDDVTILTDLSNNEAHVNFVVSVVGGSSKSVEVSALDATGKTVAASQKLEDTLVIENPSLWWPYGMNETVGYMYTLKVNVSGDVYRQPFGIRTVKVTDNQFLINGKPFYCRGVGRHEDSDLRGKGLDYTLIAKDFNMLRWLGVNCIRTSAYPYSEEFMQMCNKQGVALFDESPGVGITSGDNLSNVSLQHHIDVMGEMIRRDKNYPSVVMWSVANEPDSTREDFVTYLKTVLQYTKDKDPTHRPVNFVTDKNFYDDKVIPYVDVICLNRYYSWYSDTGHLEVIQLHLKRDLEGFRKLYQKPIIITEYGADTVSGLHREPSFVFTEEYQVQFLQEYHQEFDRAKQEYLVGEMVWSFADFMTVEDVKRVVGNKKGLLTRQRQPKPAAFIIRDRYHSMNSGNTTSCTSSNSNTPCVSSNKRLVKYTTSPHVYLHV